MKTTRHPQSSDISDDQKRAEYQKGLDKQAEADLEAQHAKLTQGGPEESQEAGGGNKPPDATSLPPFP
jgi:hypothetical protein